MSPRRTLAKQHPRRRCARRLPRITKMSFKAFLKVFSFFLSSRRWSKEAISVLESHVCNNIHSNDQKRVKIDAFFARGAWSSACQGLQMQRFGRISGFLWIGDVLGGLVDVGWAIIGPWEQWGFAKHIAKPSK